MADLPWLTQMQLEKNGTFFSSDKLNTTNATNNLVDLVRMEVFGTVGQAILVFIYSLASILALTGNTLVILVELYGKRSAKNLRKFLINLAISDLLMGVISAPIVYTDVLLGRWIFPPWLCPVGQFVQLLSVFVSTYTMTFIGIERYFATLHPISATNTWLRSHCNLVLQSGWILGILHALSYWDTTKVVPFVLDNVTYMDCSHDSDGEIKTRMTISFVLTFILPMIFLTFSYGAIGRRLFRAQQHWCSYKKANHRTEYSSNNHNNNNNNNSKGNSKATSSAPPSSVSLNNGSANNNNNNNNTAPGNKATGRQCSIASAQSSTNNNSTTTNTKSPFNRAKATRQSFKFKGKVEVMGWSVEHHEQRVPLNGNKSSQTNYANGTTTEVCIQFDRRNTGFLNKMRVFRLLVAVVILFFVCWMPIKIFMLLLAYWPSFTTANTQFGYYAYYITYFVCHWLSISNSFANPILYCFYSQSFRADLIDLLVCVYNKLRLGKDSAEERETRLGRFPMTHSHYRHSSCRLCRGGGGGGKDGAAGFGRQQSLVNKAKASPVGGGVGGGQPPLDEPIVPLHELDHQLSHHSNCSANSANSEKRKHFKLSHHKPCFFEENESEVLKRLEKIRLQSF